MQLRLQLLLLITIALSTYSFTQNNKIINVTLNDSNIVVISINHDIHMKYGCLYPMTYLINIPPGLTGLTAQRKFTTPGTTSVIWDTIPEKTSNDYFNAVEVVRFDRDSGKAYLSV